MSETGLARLVLDGDSSGLVAALETAQRNMAETAASASGLTKASDSAMKASEKAAKAAEDAARRAAAATESLRRVTSAASADTLTSAQRIVGAYREQQVRIEALSKAGADATAVERARQATMGRLQRDLAGLSTAQVAVAKTATTTATQVATVAVASTSASKQLLSLKLVLSERLAPTLMMLSPALGQTAMGIGRVAATASVLGPLLAPVAVAAAAGATAWAVYGNATADAAGRAKGLAENIDQLQKGIDPKILEAAADATSKMADGFRDLETQLLMLSGDLDEFEVQALDRIANLQAESEARRYAAGMLLKQALAEKMLIEVQNQGLDLSMKEREANVKRIHALNETIGETKRAMDAVEQENDAAMDRLTTLLLDVAAKKQENEARKTVGARVKTDTEAAKKEAEALAELVRQNGHLLRTWSKSASADLAPALDKITEAYDEMGDALAEVLVALDEYKDRVEGIGASDIIGVTESLNALKGGVTGIMAQFREQGAMAAAITEFILAPREFGKELRAQLKQLGDPKTYTAVRKVLIGLMRDVPSMLPDIVSAVVDGLIKALVDPKFWVAVVKMNANLVYQLVLGMSVAAVKSVFSALGEAWEWFASGGAAKLAKSLWAGLRDGIDSFASGLADAFGRGLKALFSLDFWAKALRGFGRYIRDVFKELVTFGTADTRTFGDTPGPVRVSASGMSARFSPGDTVIAARNSTDLLAQALMAMSSRASPQAAPAGAGGYGVPTYAETHQIFAAFERDHRRAAIRPGSVTGRRA